MLTASFGNTLPAFVLIAYGTWCNDFGRPRNAAGEPVPVDPGGRLASVLGIGLVVAGVQLAQLAVGKVDDPTT